MSRMLKIIHRSAFRELLVTFLLTIAFLNSVLMMEKLLRLSKLLAGVGATALDMARIILFLQPQLLILTIPMSLLLTTLLVYGRMHIDSEIIILRASGMDFFGIARPVLLLGILCFAAGIAMSFSLAPASGIKLRQQITRTISARAPLAIEEGTFNTSFKDIVIIVKGKKSQDTLEDIFIYDNRTKNEPKVLMAKEGKVFMQGGFDIGLDLKNGYINITSGTNTTELFFDRYKMLLSLDAESPAPNKIELTPFQILGKARVAGTKRERTALLLEFQRRLSLPAVCLILIFLGPSLSVLSGKSGKLGGLAIGLMVFAAYYMLLLYGESLAMVGRVPYYVGAWAPAFILGVFASFLFAKENAR
jgi:lipopolysaccharide export system permease protein